MKFNKESAEKLLNKLGSHTIKKFYGLDLKFEVTKLNVYHDSYTIHIKTTPEIPEQIKIAGENSWSEDRYADVLDFTFVLEDTLKYLAGENSPGNVVVENRPIHTKQDYFIDVLKNATKHFNESPELFIELSNESIIFKGTGTTFIKRVDGKLETYDPFEDRLSSLDSEEWWESLTSEDKNKIKEVFG